MMVAVLTCKSTLGVLPKGMRKAEKIGTGTIRAGTESLL
jgi:hypothetical protein